MPSYLYRAFNNCFQINDNGNCDGVGGKNVEHIYRQCTKIARSVSVLYFFTLYHPVFFVALIFLKEQIFFFFLDAGCEHSLSFYSVLFRLHILQEFRTKNTGDD